VRTSSRNGKHALKFDDVHFEVDPKVGGRVTSFSIGGIDVLSGADVDADSYGSTFWTSPQSDWGWPPPKELDRSPYSVVAGADTLTLTGEPNLSLGVGVTKQFSVDRVRGAIVLKYLMHNLSDAPKRYAPWEVSRVHSRGLTFFPSGPTSTGPLPMDRLGLGTWFAHDPTVLDKVGQKSFADGTHGFLAHTARGVLYIKSFTDVPPEMRAPGEAEIEIYANNRYVEVEVQGPYAVIEPGASMAWTVRWYLRKLPTSLAVFPGSADLLAFAASVVRPTSPAKVAQLNLPTPHSLR
jgi:hypothetical protein